eukprot:s2345_g15.t1
MAWNDMASRREGNCPRAAFVQTDSKTKASPAYTASASSQYRRSFEDLPCCNWRCCSSFAVGLADALISGKGGQRRNGSERTPQDVSVDLDVFRYELERMDASVQGTQRTVDRVVGELGRVQDVGDSLRADLEKRLSQQSKMLNVFKMELEVKLVSLENRYDKLSDDLWGEETGLAKVMHDLSHTNEVVTSMSTEFASMKHDKASIAQLQMVQEEVNNFTLETNNNVTALQQTVDRMMADMKAHFQTATNTVAAHNAAMLQEVRTAYQEELHEAAQVRKKVDEFMQSECEYRRTLEDSICKSQAQTEDLVRQVTSEVEEVGKLRRRDRNSQEVEIKAVARQLSTVQDSSQHVAQSLEHLSAVIWTMVQCERAASALDLQDDQDRSKIALMGYKEEQSELRPRGAS